MTSPQLLLRSPRLPTALLAALLLWLPGCSSRSVGPGNNNNYIGVDAGLNECADLWDCNPGVSCGELVMCEDGRCRPDLGRAIVPCTYSECTQDTDCVVAVAANCCHGCPQVVSREALEDLECFYTEETLPDILPPGCDMLCYHCDSCVPQPLGARCDDGLCVPSDLGCPDFSDAEVPTVTTLELVQNAGAHDGQLRRVRGVVMVGEGSCDGEGCSVQYDAMLNGVVRLDGYQCDLAVGITGDECRANLQSAGAQVGGWYEYEGIVHDNPDAWQPPWLEVTGSRLVEPENLGGLYPSLITDIESDASDPTCVPPHWNVGDELNVQLAQSGAQIWAAAPSLHCESNFSGGFNDGPVEHFSTSLPIDCLDCDFSIHAMVVGDQLTGEYHWMVDGCSHVVSFEGTRQRF